ncbi:diacylglycerol/lipid kinase family protein [Salinibius halmophilus]|uniref:diacylglycerol/lipid kinase family protein n=1 Tax=Salinibius halmophilus TaxID=1853216 RepID=UPI001313F313|nr:diacylglycerol kinase family protein [Salinibius halmophilus]
MAHRVLLFAHPKRARFGRFNLDNVQATLVALGHHVSVLYSLEDRATSIALLARAAQSTDEVVVLGGDGTVNAAANALVHSDVILTILPTGTGNDYVRSLGRRKVSLTDRLLAKPRWVDVGEVNGDVFVNAAGLGFDVAVLQHMASKSKKMTQLAYKFAALLVIARYSPNTVVVHYGQRRLCLPTLLLVVAKGGFFGGGIKIAEQFNLDNSKLRLAWSSHVGALQRWPFLLNILAGRIPATSDEPPIIQQDITSIKVVTPGLAMQLDGELIQQTPAYIRVLPRALRVRAL